MSLSQFLATLVESGQVVVSLDFAEETGPEADQILAEMDRATRQNLSGTAPEFMPDVAHWAACILHRGCQFLVCRDVDASLIGPGLREPCPAPRCPATDYSADLALQYLPDLIGMTRQAAAGDPLLEHLLALAREWPLSSVGVREVEAPDVQSFIGDAALRQLYVDRILAREDVSRLGNPRVDGAVREALGAFPELCWSVAARVQSPALSSA
jgi:hypothetical protein